MNLTGKILNRCNVIVVSFSDTEDYALRLLECRYSSEGFKPEAEKDLGGLDDMEKNIKAVPFIVALTGYGVLSKDISMAPDIAGKVTAEDSGFLWTQVGGRLSFVREEQVMGLLSDLQDCQAKIIHIMCIAPDSPGDDVLRQASLFYNGATRFATIIKPSGAGSVMAMQLAGRLKMPVLVLVLLALVINAVLSGDIRDKFSSSTSELQALEQTAGRADDLSRQKKEAITDFDKTLPYGYAQLCDRVAMVLPPEILLTSLAIQPPLKTIEENRPVQLAEYSVEIAGESTASEPVSGYVSALQLAIAEGDVRLASVEQNRDNGKYAFRINISL